MPEIAFRPYETADFPAVARLWHEAGLHPSQSDTPESLARKQLRDPELFILAIAEGCVVGSVMGSYDGRRGWINKLAVLPECLGRDIGGRLLAEAERRLRAIGFEMVNLLIEYDNAKVVGYYQRHGYATDALIFMEKWLA
jgi:ribosomal protein S18 acetylase RimI-like enzyme